MREKKIIGYTDPLSAAPGERVRFMVSCEPGVARYRADIVRVLSADDQPGGPGLRTEAVATGIEGEYPAQHQATHAGSFAVVEDAPAFAALQGGLGVQALIMPTLLARPGSTLVSRMAADAGAGFALCIDEHGALQLEIGNGRGGFHRISTGVPLVEWEWYLVGAAWERESGIARVFQQPLGIAHAPVAAGSGELRVPAAVVACAAPLFIGGRDAGSVNGRPVASDHWNGRIERPLLASRPLPAGEGERLRRGPLPAELQPSIVCCHDFSRGIEGDHVTDISPHRLHGRLYNQPIRAVPSSDWDGSEHNWTHRPAHYAAVHFVEDSLDDCNWQADFELEIPPDLPSGIYAARLHIPGDEQADTDLLPFFVRPPRGTATAAVAFLVPTASYFAYANVRTYWDDEIDEMLQNRLLVYGAGDRYLMQHPELGYSTYDRHNDGMGVCYSTRKRPILNMRPDHPSLWQMSADMHLLAWLSHEDIACDIITDEDLHAEGLSLLANYRCVMTGTHPEYYSTAMWDAVHAFLNRGGRLMYLGGNGFYWRVAFSDDKPGVMEMRRAEDGSRAWAARPGEYHMSYGGELGGLWWRCGRPPQQLVGVGFTAQGFALSSHFRRQPAAGDPRASWVFEGVEGEVFGDHGLIGGGAAGIELDFAERSLGTPAHALVLASSEQHTDTYLHVNELIGHMYSAIGGAENPKVRADMVLFETANGGAVWSTGSIGWCSALPTNGFDNDVARITGNVVRRFSSEEPFAPPA